MPAVSVITPAWNSAPFIGPMIDSVRAQSVVDWELLIVDDGSTDETVAIVERHAREDSRIRLVRQANAGPSAARNHAMRIAGGRYFAFLDSDDLWHPDFLHAQLDVFAHHPETSLVTATGLYLGGPFDGQPTRAAAGGFSLLPLEEIIEDETAVFIMTVFRRQVFETIGGFDEAQWTSEDYDFWIRAALAGFVFRRNPRPLGQYRVRGVSLSRNRARMLQGILLTFEKTRPYCAEGTRERRALDAQVARMESELLLEEGKTALERRDFALAADRLRTLRARGGGTLIGLTAWLAEHAPILAVLMYKARAWRTTRLRGRRSPSPHRPRLEAAV